MSEVELREYVRRAGLRLRDEGLVARTWGNVSVRLDSNHMLITPSGIPYNEITPDMISTVDIVSGDWSGPLKPSGERKLHAEIYRRRSDVGAVIHTHQNAASVFAACHRALSLENLVSPSKRALDNAFKSLGGSQIRCAPYALPSTSKLTIETAKAVGNDKAAFMANHGVVCVGDGLEAALETAIVLEQCCSMFLGLDASSLPAPVDRAWRDEWLGQPGNELAEFIAATLGTVLKLGGNFVALSIAPYTVEYSRKGTPMPPVLDDIAQLIGVKLDSCDISSQVEVRRKIGKLKRSGALLIRGHGALCIYPNKAEAEAAAMVIEKTARALIAGEVLGGAKAIPAWEAALMRFIYKNSYSKQAGKIRTAR